MVTIAMRMTAGEQAGEGGSKQRAAGTPHKERHFVLIGSGCR